MKNFFVLLKGLSGSHKFQKRFQKLAKPAQKILAWITSHKVFMLFFGLMALWILPHLAAAQADPVDTTPLQDAFSTPESQKVYNDMVTILVTAMEFLQTLLNYILLLIGALLKNDLLYSAGMEETMYVVWSNIRNIVNILFVVVLLGIAFYNIVGGKAQDYQLKEILPKFVIALIAVNFSFLGVKVVVDGVSIVTDAMFALPSAVQRDLQQTESFQSKVCEFYYGKTNEDYTKKLDAAGWNNDPETTKALCTPTKVLSRKGKEYFARFGSHNAAIVMAINLANISDIDKVQLGKDLKLSKLFVNALLTVFLYIIYGAAFVALTIILLVRLVTLWVTIILSPLIVLRYVLPESIKSAIGGGDDLSKQFVQNAIAPVPIALMMSIGFIMLNSLKFAQFNNVTLATDTFGTTLLTSGLNTLQDMIVAFGMVGIIWAGVFAAAKGTSAESAVEGIKSTMEGAGKFLLAAPLKYAPLFPSTTIKSDDGKPINMSLGGALGALGNIPNALHDRQMEESSRIAKALLGQDAFKNTKDIKDAKTPKDALQAFVNGVDNRKTSKDFQNEIYRKFDENASWKNHPAFDWNFNFRDSKGKISKEKFLQQLKEGTADPAVLKEWLEASRRKNPGMVPQTPGAITAPTPGQPGSPLTTPTTSTPGIQPAVDLNTAKEIMENSGFNAQKQALTAGQQKELDDLRKNLNNAKNSQEVENLLAKQAANLQDLDEIRKISTDFNSSISDILTKQGTPKEKKEKVNTRIQQYRNDLIAKIKQREPNASDADLEKRANKAMIASIDSLPPEAKQSEEAQKVINNVGSEASDLKKIPDKVVVSAAAVPVTTKGLKAQPKNP